MAGFTWIFAVCCVTGRHLSAASPVLQSGPVVQVGQNVTLFCNLTSRDEITWFQLRSDQLLPLLTVRRSKVEGQTVDQATRDGKAYNTEGDLETGPVTLEILEVEEQDAGLYFCTGRGSNSLSADRGIHLKVTGSIEDPVRDGTKQPCWSLGVCLLPGLISLCFVVFAGLYLSTGKPAVCRRGSGRRDWVPSETEDASLHYSSLKRVDKLRPSVRGRSEDVTYAAVNTGTNRDGPQNRTG